MLVVKRRAIVAAILHNIKRDSDIVLSADPQGLKLLCCVSVSDFHSTEQGATFNCCEQLRFVP